MLPKTTASHLKSLRAAERGQSAGTRTEPHDGRRNAAVFKVGRRMEKWWERETYRVIEGRGGRENDEEPRDEFFFPKIC